MFYMYITNTYVNRIFMILSNQKKSRICKLKPQIQLIIFYFKYLLNSYVIC